MKTLQLLTIYSEDFCPETGIYYANYKIRNGCASWTAMRKIYQYEKLLEVDNREVNWTYFVDIQNDDHKVN